ncbi:MAG: protein-L-isoaspartate O-methyltransferase [Rhodobacteraceae bacterium]|nr:protein-L-isoaspartate O-methyltransferase [Paracoccaceae bacterium]
MSDYAQARLAMVDGQVRPADVNRFPVIQAMLTVPRERFLPRAARSIAYADTQIPLGEGRVMLEPRAQGKMLDLLALEPDALVLHLGCGHGYGTALLAQLGQAVVAVENEALAAEAREALVAEGVDNAIVEVAPLTEGAPRHGPYDAIVIDGGSVETMPEAIAAQLKDGGRIVALFSEDRLGRCRLGIKTGGTITWRHAFDAWAPVLPGFEARREFVF